MRSTFVLTAAMLATSCIGAPIWITIQGTFQRSEGTATVFDNQAYSVSFPIVDQETPIQEIVSPDLVFRSVVYGTSGALQVPGIGLSVISPLQVQFIQDSTPFLPFSQWMNIFVFAPLPVGDYMVMTPLFTTNGDPIWNGLAGGLGTPVLFPLAEETVSARWFLEQIPGPNLPGIPLAVYESQTDLLSIADVPEPGPLLPVAAGVLALALLRRSR